MKTKEAYLLGARMLKEAGIETHFLDTEIIITHIKNISRTDFFIRDYELTKEEEELIFTSITNRAARMPIAYITGQKEFMSLPFHVDQNVLIPRPDTEILAETAIDMIKKENMGIAMDVGCGSGCISISLSHYTDVFAIGIDISETCVEISKKNARENQLEHKTVFMKSNLFDNIPDWVTVDLIVSNPPYIERKLINDLMPDVRYYEPYTALCGGDDGLYFYKKIASQGKNFLKHSGVILFEIGFSQKDDVYKILKDEQYKNIDVLTDLAHKDRVILGYKK